MSKYFQMHEIIPMITFVNVCVPASFSNLAWISKYHQLCFIFGWMSQETFICRNIFKHKNPWLITCFKQSLTNISRCACNSSKLVSYLLFPACFSLRFVFMYSQPNVIWQNELCTSLSFKGIVYYTQTLTSLWKLFIAHSRRVERFVKSSMSVLIKNLS